MDQATCAEHQSVAVGTCPRCGAFLCPKCTWQTLCATCFRRRMPEEDAAQRARDLARASWMAFVISLGVAVFSPSALASLLLNPVLWLAGLGAGVGALWSRRGAPNVVTPACVGLVLNGGSICLVLLAALARR